MERRRDTPFFVEKNGQRRHGLRLIQGSGEVPMDLQTRIQAADNQIREQVIVRFLEESGLGSVLENSTVDPSRLEEKFSKFIRAQKRSLPRGLQKLVESMTFSGVARSCREYARRYRRAVGELSPDAPQELRDSTFPAARRAAEIDSIMQKAVSATASQKAASRNIVIIRPDENPTEAS